MKTDGSMKRSTIRFYLKNPKSRKAWDALGDYERFGYSTRQDFIQDAITAYHGWLESGTLPYTRSELESEMKRWMREVLMECSIPIQEQELPSQKSEENEAEEGIIENSILAMANDFLSTL